MSTLEEIISQWDGEQTILYRDAPTGAMVVVAIHSSRRGTPSGGTRMQTYPDLVKAVQDAHNLSMGMTLKFAVADLNRGGGKAVISLPAEFDAAERNGLLRRYGTFIKRLGGLFETGPEVGTTDRDMDVIAETGAPHVFCRTVENGGCGDTGPATALGVFYGIQAVCKHLYGSPSRQGRRVLIQGAGSVGRPLIDHLEQARAETLFSDVDTELSAIIEATTSARFIQSEEAIETKCDIFSPCAMGGVLNAETIPKLKCRAMAGGANNQLATPDDAERLQARNILYAPDYAINIGGAMVATLMELEGKSRAAAEQRVQSVANTFQHILQVAEARNITTEKAAQQIAADRLEPDHA